MSTSVAAAGASSGQPVIGLDPGAVVLVLMDETQTDMNKVQAPTPSSSGGNGSSGHTLDQYA
jgi:hypothetical protein